VETNQSESPESQWTTRAYLLLAGVVTFRLVYLACDPFDLVHDEAYYWDWSRQLDYGYFSKPPMIAWIIWCSTTLFGDNEFAVRLPAVFFGTGSLLFLFWLARRLYDAQTAFWATLLAVLTPGNAAMSLVMTIDSPFLFFWAAASYCFWRLLQPEDRNLKWLVLTMVVIGLGLLTKQTMLALFVFGGIFVLLSPDDRIQAIRPRLYLCTLGALLFLTPVIVWNYQHGWVTLEHTSEHFSTEQVSIGRRMVESLEFIGGQLGVITPVTFFLMAVVGVLGLSQFHRLGRKERYLLCCGPLPLVFVLLLSLKQHLELNWPAPFFGTGLILVAAWALGKFSLSWSPFTPRVGRLYHAAIVGGVFVAATYLMPFALQWSGMSGSKLDVVVRMRGWQELGQLVSETLDDHKAQQPIMIVAEKRSTASELAFYLPSQPQVHVWSGHDLILSQYDLWGGPSDRVSHDIVLVTGSSDPVPPALANAFTKVTRLEQVEVEVGSKRKHSVTLWRGEGFRGWEVAKQFSVSGETFRR